MAPTAVLEAQGSRSAAVAPSSRVPVFIFAALVLSVYLIFGSQFRPHDIAAPKLLAIGGILFCAGFISGLAGFGFSAIGASIVLVLPPTLAIPLLQGLSMLNQATSIGQLRKEMPAKLSDWWPAGPGPAVLGGLAGVPVGVWLLHHLPAHTLTLIIGSIIAGYALFSLFRPAGLVLRGFDGAKSGIAVGALGGAIGGFTAFPGVAVVVWTALRNTPKNVTRALAQPYIIVLQVLALITNAVFHPATFGSRYWILLLLTVPVVIPGTMTGVAVYRAISDRDFKRLCLLLLVLSGGGLIFKTLF